MAGPLAALGGSGGAAGGGGMLSKIIPMAGGGGGGGAGSIGGAIGGGIDLIGGLIGLYHGMRSRKEGKDKLDEIENLIKSIVPPDIEINPDNLLRAPELIMKQIETRPLDFSRVEPQKLQRVASYSPEIAPLIQEAAPQMLEQSQKGKMGDDAFMDTLREMRRIGRSGGSDPIAQAATQRAMEAANQATQGRQQSILQDAARRGTAGGGADIAAQLMGASDAMGQSAEMARSAEADAYQRQIQAMRDAGRMGRELSQDELGKQQYNTSLINDYNRRLASRQQEHAGYRAGLLNDAQLYNQGEDQRISDANKDRQYAADVNNRGYLNDLSFRDADFRRSEQQRMNDLRQQDFSNRGTVQDDLFRRKQQDYQNRRGATMDRAGIMQDKYRDIINRGKGTQQNIQGITRAASSIPRSMGKQQSQAQPFAAPEGGMSTRGNPNDWGTDYDDWYRKRGSYSER